MPGKPGLMRRQTSFGHNCCLPETVFPKVGLQTLGHRFAGCMCVCWGRWVPGSKKSGRHGRHATVPSWGITVHTAPDRLWETLQWRKLVTVWPRTFSFHSTQWRHQESQVILECGVSPSSQVNDTPRTGFPPRHVQCSFYKHVLEHYLKAAVFAL